MSDAIAPDLLRSFVERIEHLEEEKASIAGDIKEVYLEAKAQGFEVKIIRKIVALRRRDAAEWREEQEILEIYLNALGMLADLPLGKAAISRAVAEDFAHRRSEYSNGA